jgi:hypothetical protein
MMFALLLSPVLTLATPVALASALVSDPSVERASEQHHPQPARKRERTKPAPDAPCTGCATSSSAHPPMLEAPVPGLLLIPAEAAAF